MTAPARGLVSDRVAGIEPQKIRVLFDLAAEHDGADTVHLEVGEPDFDTPTHIVDAACEAARGGNTRYTPNAGLLELRRAIATSLARDRGQDVDPETEVVVTTGGTEALHLAMLALSDPGDEVVVPTPTWPNPIMQAKLAGATPREVALHAETGFALEPERVIDAMSSETAVVLLSSPSNPTGRVFDLEAMETVVDAAAEYDAVVVADDVYGRLAYDTTPPLLATETVHPERVVTVGSVSKTYAMTGWRVGWITGSPSICRKITMIHEGTSSCVATPSQHAAIAALTGPQKATAKMSETYARRRDFVVDRVASIPGLSCPTPEGAFYAFLNVSSLEGTSMEISKRLLYEYDVVTAPGSAFGDAGDGHLRISFANGLERLEVGFDRLERMVRSERG